MKLYNLGNVPWLDSQLIYHALPQLGLEGLILLAPAEPYLCIGCHQDVEQDIDLDYCRSHDIPVFRREVGGGGVYLDGDQLFFQLILHQDHPQAQGSKADLYRRMLEPVAGAYGDLGVAAMYKPVNDVITIDGRKVSGTGAAEIAGHVVLVGNIIQDFDYEAMVRVLKVPDEKFRDKIYQTMRENLTTLQRETGRTPPLEEIVPILVNRFEDVLGPLEPAVLPPVVQEKVQELATLLTSDEWFYRRGRRLPGHADRTHPPGQAQTDVKIATGVKVRQRLYKAPGGLIRATSEVKDGKIAWVSLSGDFFFYPARRLADLEAALIGVRVDAPPRREDAPRGQEDVEGAIARFYAEHGVESPGVTPTDLARVLA